MAHDGTHLKQGATRFSLRHLVHDSVPGAHQTEIDHQDVIFQRMVHPELGGSVPEQVSDQSVIAVKRLIHFVHLHRLGVLHQGASGLEKTQLVRARDLRSVVSRSLGTQDEETRVAEPIEEQTERYRNNEDAY